MTRGSVYQYTDPRRILEYVLENPGRAAKIALVAIVVLVVTVLSITVEAVPLWIAGYVLAGVVLFFAHREVQRVMLVRAATEDGAGAVTPGPTKVHGTVVPATEELTESPSGTECVAYRHQHKRGGAGSDSTRHTESDAIPFYVEDETGQALVSPRGARLELKHDEGKRLLLLGSRGRKESYLEPGDTVAVYGEGVSPGVDYDPTEAAASEAGSAPDGEGQPAPPLSEGMDVPAEHLPEGVDSPEELIDRDDAQPPEDMPPQYREYYREKIDEGGFPGMPAQSAATADSKGGMLREMAETAAEFPGRYDHLFGGEEFVVGQGPDYGTVLITDKSGFRVFGKQLLVTIALLAAGIAILAASGAAMLGIVQL